MKINKANALKGIALLGGISIAGYVVYQMYKKAQMNDAVIAANSPQQVTYPVQPIGGPKPKPKPVLRVVGY